MAIHENIRKIRKEKGFTQKQLGDLCEPKIAEANIRKYELGKANPKLETLERIALALKVPVELLLYDIADFATIIQTTLKNQVNQIYNEHPDNPKPFLVKALQDSQNAINEIIELTGDKSVIDILEKQGKSDFIEQIIAMHDEEIKKLQEKNESEKLILVHYNKLNDAGKLKAIEYTTDLAQMKKYQRDPDTKK